MLIPTDTIEWWLVAHSLACRTLVVKVSVPAVSVISPIPVIEIVFFVK